VNGNMLLERNFFTSHPEVLIMPPLGVGEAWDVHHATSFLSSCRASSSVHCNWREVGVRPEFFAGVAESAVWWHGVKDGNFVDEAGHFVDRTPVGSRPMLIDFGPALDLVVGGDYGGPP
jgi:hypothetical protein